MLKEVVIMSLDKRKLKILSTIIDIHVKTGEPVGSKAVCDALDISISSATVRNEMASLSEAGLLEQPHTSSGRIPSSQGYRLYINELMKPKPIPKQEQRIIYANLSDNISSPSELLSNAANILASMSKFVAISTSPIDSQSHISNIQLVQTGQSSAMLVIAFTPSDVVSRSFRCKFDLNSELLNVFNMVLSKKFVGVKLYDIDEDFIRKVALDLGELAILMSPVLAAIHQAVKKTLKKQILLEGQTNLLFLPGLNINSVRQTLDFLNHKDKLIKLLDSEDGDVKVLVGFEMDQPELIDSSIILSKYRLDGRYAGTIGILGPTRMDYAKMISSIKYLSEVVGELLEQMLNDN